MSEHSVGATTPVKQSNVFQEQRYWGKEAVDNQGFDNEQEENDSRVNIKSEFLETTPSSSSKNTGNNKNVYNLKRGPATPLTPTFIQQNIIRRKVAADEIGNQHIESLKNGGNTFTVSPIKETQVQDNCIQEKADDRKEEEMIADFTQAELQDLNEKIRLIELKKQDFFKNEDYKNVKDLLNFMIIEREYEKKILN
ncbi:hypothetical protein PACTADRAFT_34345 [Pachysolen tannophilus NRRL Y-2460]|uniref:Uncharacterized protein n=1 Tax=Pachysolen tannophilus NRRL Y-2460 TaxID=669874 RepID=A0A1E4TS69_PACTA|nr:hypothetical protein PACTADRAFT_34345 [Pachysolen tannophilus NRRL Y-2460]